MPKSSRKSTPRKSAPRESPTPDYAAPEYTMSEREFAPFSLGFNHSPPESTSLGQPSHVEPTSPTNLQENQPTETESPTESTAPDDAGSPSSSSSTPVDGNKCSRCRHYKDKSLFMGRTRSYRTCSDCRFAQTVPKRPPTDMIPHLFDLKIPASEVAVDSDISSMDTTTGTSTYNTRRESRNKQATTLNFDIVMDEELLQQSDEDVVEAILDVVKRRSGYRYSVQNLTKPLLSTTVNFYGKCVQRSDLRRPLQADERKRQTKILPTYNCKGKIAGSIDRVQRWIRLSLTHLSHHPSTHPTRKLMPEEAKAYIKEMADSEKSNSELYKEVVDNFGSGITRAQVYFWRREARRNL